MALFFRWISHFLDTSGDTDLPTLAKRNCAFIHGSSNSGLVRTYLTLTLTVPYLTLPYITVPYRTLTLTLPTTESRCYLVFVWKVCICAIPTMIRKIFFWRHWTIIAALSLLRSVCYFNKARYTAISCGRVGRGGNARFPTFQLVLTDQPTDQPTDGRTKPLTELRVRN